jgi:collagenase-like PrtC family protease
VSVPQIELLAPARDLESGIAAINCGADAVYIGAGRFGAREAAGNPLEDIEALARHAHKYWAKVYVTLNTLLRDDEIPEAVRLAHQVHEVGVDALILQDPGLLECSLPPIPLFASTQMHNNTPEKVAFLEKVGFQRVILARELTLNQIESIRAATSIELEAFIHGALCVCHSGQCYLSYALGGRSGNRGECAQPCRRPYSLLDRNGNRLVANRYLLSIRDLNLTGQLRELLDAGVTSLKIEGRLKDKAYVANVVAHYRREIDAILRRPVERRSSSGTVEPDFVPDPAKTFNRGYTHWYPSGVRETMGSKETPKMVGEPVGEVLSCGADSFVLSAIEEIHNGDGICFFRDDGELAGTLVNRAEGNVIYPARMEWIRKGLAIFRNYDRNFLGQLERNRAARHIGVRMSFSESPAGYGLIAQDEDGVSVSRDLACEKVHARDPEKAKAVIEKRCGKLGDTEFFCIGMEVLADPVPFLPISALNELRRGLVDALRAARSAARPAIRASVSPNNVPYPETQLGYTGNVLNRKAEEFYRRHGVRRIEPAAESGLDMRGRRVMSTTYCIKYELGACPQENQAQSFAEPLFLVDENGRRLRLEFDCAECCMHVILDVETH